MGFCLDVPLLRSCSISSYLLRVALGVDPQNWGALPTVTRKKVRHYCPTTVVERTHEVSVVENAWNPVQKFWSRPVALRQLQEWDVAPLEELVQHSPTYVATNLKHYVFRWTNAWFLTSMMEYRASGSIIWIITTSYSVHNIHYTIHYYTVQLTTHHHH